MVSISVRGSCARCRWEITRPLRHLLAAVAVGSLRATATGTSRGWRWSSRGHCRTCSRAAATGSSCGRTSRGAVALAHAPPPVPRTGAATLAHAAPPVPRTGVATSRGRRGLMRSLGPRAAAGALDSCRGLLDYAIKDLSVRVSTIRT
jgi:hypothetical protein